MFSTRSRLSQSRIRSDVIRATERSVAASVSSWGVRKRRRSQAKKSPSGGSSYTKPHGVRVAETRAPTWHAAPGGVGVQHDNTWAARYLRDSVWGESHVARLRVSGERSGHE